MQVYLSHIIIPLNKIEQQCRLLAAVIRTSPTPTSEPSSVGKIIHNLNILFNGKILDILDKELVHFLSHHPADHSGTFVKTKMLHRGGLLLTCVYTIFFKIYTQKIFFMFLY